MRLIKKTIKYLLSSNVFTKLMKGQKFIFLYHDISDPTSSHYSPLYSTSKASFYEQVHALKKHFTFVSVDDLLHKDLSSAENFASIVFDDGFYSVYENAFHFLTHQNIPFKIFVNKTNVCNNQNWITHLELNQNNDYFIQNYYDTFLLENKPSLEEFKQNPFKWALEFNNYSGKFSSGFNPINSKIYCDVDDLKEMLKTGMVTISSHSTNHFVLSKCTDKILKNEIEENYIFIQELGIKNDEHFAIPFGNKRHYNQTVIDMCKLYGYKYIHTTNPNAVMPPFKNDINLIPRIGIYTHRLSEVYLMVNKTLFVSHDL